MSTQVIYSSIRPELKLSMIRRGLVLGLLGVGIFLYMGMAMTPGELQVWGIPGFFASGVCVTLGLKPYRRLTTLEIRPHQLHLGPWGRIEFFYGGKPFLAVMAQGISELRYRDTLDSYGVVVSVTDLQAVQALQVGLDLPVYAASTRRRYGGDLFFPLLSRRGFEELKVQTARYRAS